ncbi:MAG: pirin family protein [Proteobacteria bacterium]|nr:pirin family protein [Pseudomonadota bacterium]MBU1717117.1 pirin family protein [Pseudomonadota bacterium]
MKTPRKIRQVFKSKPVIEGAGVHLHRALGFDEVPLFDPFLLFDDFRSDRPEHFLRGFPWHPHRGIETITYVLRGEVEHGDSMGNKGDITSGDVQWMTAGSGIIHQEMPKGDADGRMEGFQLWANLPAAQKMMAPRYRDVKAAQIPTVRLVNGVEIKVISGQVGATQGPVRDIVIDPEYIDVTVPPATNFTHPTKMGHTVFVYVIGGQGFFGQEQKPFADAVQGDNYFDLPRDTLLGNETLILYADGDHLTVSTGGEPVRFLLIAGKPLNEPVAWQGPIVMNTQDELRLAFDEYRQGTFVKNQP